MVVDFAALDLNSNQTLLLKNLDGTIIQPLWFAKGIKGKLSYNEVSELTFELPAYADNFATPNYNKVVGMRIIDWVNVGQFILINPEVVADGVEEYKNCKAYLICDTIPKKRPHFKQKR